MPRSATLALWLPRLTDPARGATAGSRAGGAEVAPELLARALATVRAEDEPHTVRLGSDSSEVPLADVVRSWAPRVSHVTALFPVAGDVAGVPAAASVAAVDAEECVLVTLRAGSTPGSPQDDRTGTGETWALVPLVTPFGSVIERGYLVTWEALRVPPWRSLVLAAVGDLREAERELRSVLVQATEALDALDVASWSDDARSVLEGLTGYRALADVVPEDLDQRRARVLSESARLRYIIDAATRDDGGAVNLWQADQRSAALRHVDRVARRAMAAATAFDEDADQH